MRKVSPSPPDHLIFPFIFSSFFSHHLPFTLLLLLLLFYFNTMRLSLVPLLLVCAVLFISSSRAHFALTTPASRGNDDQTLNQTNCGGSNTPITAVPFISTSAVSVTIEDGHGTVTLNFALGGDFTKITQLATFAVTSTTSGGINSFSVNFDGKFSNNTAGVLQAIYQELNDVGDTYDATYYQCADVILRFQASAAATLQGGVALGIAVVAVMASVTLSSWI